MEPLNSEDFGSAGEDFDAVQDQDEGGRKPSEGAPKMFQCSCGKAYLSYSALYSHNKQKHGGEPTNLPSGRGGRKRGRPPKNGDAVRSRPKPTETVVRPDIEQEDDSYFKQQGLMGGPVDPRACLTFDSPLYRNVETLMQNTENHYEETATCSDAFAGYLIAMSQRLSNSGMEQVIEFIEKLRDCVNQKEGDDYSDVNSPQSLPEQANYFISEYLDSHSGCLERSAAIELMLHFCRWLFIRHYSNLKLSLNDKD